MGPRAAAGRRSRVRSLAFSAAAALLVLAACESPAPSETDPAAPFSPVAGLGVGDETVTVVAAGDIARRPDDGVGTAKLIASARPDAVLALGDNAYDDGTASEYRENYDPTWGAFKAITRPIPGNHEYGTEDAEGYFDYFDEQIHDWPYYAWDAGLWRMYALNCDIECGRSSEQVAWLIDDLAEHADKPALAYVHEPLYTCSTRHPPLRRLDDIWDALQAARGQIMVSANNHAYERFAPMDAEGRPAPDGLRQFVVGTGGANLYPLVTPCANREAQTDETTGILKLELHADSYEWEFIGVDGDTLDSGEEPVS